MRGRVWHFPRTISLAVRHRDELLTIVPRDHAAWPILSRFRTVVRVEGKSEAFLLCQALADVEHVTARRIVRKLRGYC